MPEGRWIVEDGEDFVSDHAQKKDALKAIGYSTSKRIETGIYQAGPYIIRRT